VFNLAADMGGMGFIQSNHGVIFYNNTMITFNMMEAARQAGVKRSVSAIMWHNLALCCVNNRDRAEVVALRHHVDWRAYPEARQRDMTS
jgi:hypothetical protein